MRTATIFGILLSELLIIALFKWEISSSALSLISTMVVVVVVAFAISALLRNIKSLKLSRNYSLSGIIGVVLGIAYFLWAKDNLEAMVNWLKDFGIYFLLLFIFICCLFLFFTNRTKAVQAESLSELQKE